MAKIGNETKLILKLATDQAKAKYEAIMKDKGQLVDYQNGYAKAFYDWINILQLIVLELEGK